MKLLLSFFLALAVAVAVLSGQNPQPLTSSTFLAVMSGTGNGTASIVNPPQNTSWFTSLSEGILNSPPVRWPNLSRETRVQWLFFDCVGTCTVEERIRHNVSASPSGSATTPIGYQSGNAVYTQARTGMTLAGSTGSVMFTFSGSSTVSTIPLGIKLKAGEAFGVNITATGAWNVRFIFEER